MSSGVTVATAAVDPANLTSPGSTMGTVAYMSPERARGEERIRSDPRYADLLRKMGFPQLGSW